MPCRGPSQIAVTGECEHNKTPGGKRHPFPDLWLSMLSACGDEERKLGNLFHDQKWDTNGLACDVFEDEGEDDEELIAVIDL